MITYTTSGSPYERGQQQGQACTSLALPWIARTQQAIADRPPVRDALANPATVDAYRKGFERVYPDGYAEYCGIADGLGIPAHEYFTIMASQKLLYEQFFYCTTIGYRLPDGSPIFGKTDDIFFEDLGMNVLELTTPDQGYRHAHFHCAGTIWTVAGINECGLAMGMTGVPGPVLDTDGVTELEGLHMILPACADIQEAIALIQEMPLCAQGFSLIMGDATGEMALVEKNTAGMAVLPAIEATFTHTNHLLDPSLAARCRPLGEPLHSNGVARLNNARSLLAELPHTPESLETMLHDRSPHGAIFQQGEDEFYTDFAIIFQPTERRMHWWYGQPGPLLEGTLTLDENSQRFAMGAQARAKSPNLT